ncbi:uncharacterized protein znf106b isoform X1 [Onychostoma macrolepis]|uniref:C2H2-type domain-containing protein n=1 Tax=Onychostoma macrolepis TaxID=369639 RepID=A0A7J6BWX3_9TELE|nr:uncharacterized protein znf106b isoform X1 [Onychostoma macrolepis]KAF4099499.1 hypothetical protein G5714_019625 [Onychostoma macrolepis]
MSKKTKKTNGNFGNNIRCFICGQQYGQKFIDMHMHSYLHHEAIEKIKGSEQLHKCWACNVSVMGLEQYKEHIADRNHTQNLFKLNQNKRRKRKSFKPDYNIDLTDNELESLFGLREQDGSKDEKSKEQKDLDKCSICFHRFPEQEWDKHMHSLIHRQTVEQLKGSEHEHKCWACEMTVTGIAAFKEHVSTQYHKMKLSDLTKNRILGKKTVDYSVEFNELKDLCAQREQEKFMKKKERLEKWKEAKRRKTMRLIQTRSRAEHKRYTTPFMVNEEFEADQLPPSCHFMSFWENQNDYPASIQHNLPSQRQESIVDMDRSDGPLVKRPRLERPSENIPQEMSAHGTRPNPDGKGTDVSVNDLTPETEDGAAAEPTCAPGLVQSRMEANIPNLTAAMGVCLTQKAATGNEAVVLNPPLHTRSKKSTLKVNRAASLSEQGMTRECMSGQEPYADSLPPASALAKVFESQASENELEIVENVRPHTAHVQKNQSNECETEQGETSLEHHSSFEAISCNVQKTQKRRQDDSHDLNPETNNKISRKRKVNKLISLSLKEEELTSSLENVGEQLFQAYSTLQSAYIEVQRLLAVKQEVTSEMASLRAQRIKILQDMKNPGDQQEVLHES